MPLEQNAEADKPQVKDSSADSNFQAELNDIFDNQIQGYNFEPLKAKSEPEGDSLEVTNPFTVEDAAKEVVKGAKPVGEEPDTKGGDADTGKQSPDGAAPEKSPERKGEGDGEGDKQPEAAPEKVKLDRLNFDESQVQEAIDLAKKHNLPVAVYTGATWCPACPSAGAKFNEIAHDMESMAETPAVMIKLDADNANRLASQGGETGRMLREFMGDADRIPNVAVYNPNDVSRPIADATVAGWGKGTMNSHMNQAFEKVTGSDSKPEGDRRPEPKQKKVDTTFDANSIKDAVQKAQDSGLPLLTHVTEGGADENVAKAFKYLNDNGLAVAANVDAKEARDLRSRGLESSHFQALGSAISRAEGAGNTSGDFFNAFDAEALKGGSMKFKPDESSSPKDTDAAIDFIKQSGVDLSSPQHEAAVRALLEGKPIPEVKEVEETEEQTEAKSENIQKVNTAEEAKAVIAMAREKGLPLVVHADTAVCDDNSCSTQELDEGIQQDLKDDAVFMEIPRGGFDPASAKGNAELERLNELFKVSLEDHKTEVDLHAFRFDKGKDGAMEEQISAFPRSFNLKMYIHDLIKERK